MSVDLNAMREIVNDPVKLEAHLKAAFEKLDKDHKGYVSFETVHKGLEGEAAKHGKVVHEEDHKPGELEAARKVADPNGTDRVDFQGFKNLCLGIIKYAKDAKHHHGHGHGH